MTRWLLFTYKVPNEPSARRVYIWRKLKSLGAISLHEMIWVLPATPDTREKLQWLTSEVHEMEGGDATLWEAEQVLVGQDEQVAQMFLNQVNAVYRDILTHLNGPSPDLEMLAKRYQQAKRQDYFGSVIGEQVRNLLVERRG